MKNSLNTLKNKFIIKFKKDNIICYIILILVSLLICIPLTLSTFFATHDGVLHLARNYATIEGIKDGQIVPTIVSNFCGGFGYSWNLFYPPLSTYINAIFYCIIHNYFICIKLTIMFSIILSSIFMYNLMNDVSKNKKIALMVSIIYITSIYFITDIYVRLAIGEIMVYMFLPILFRGLYDIFYENGKKNYLLTFGAVGILLSHNISSLIISIISSVFIIIHIKKLYKSKESSRIWKNLFINAGFIILIVLFFYIPLLQHKFATEYLALTGIGFTSKKIIMENRIFIYQLIYGKFQFGYSLPPNEGIDGEMCFSLGLPILIPLLFTPICYKKIRKDRRILYISTLIIGIITALMATDLFSWDKMPKIFIFIQFPWRMLLYSTFLLSIIAGINIVKCIENRRFIKLKLFIIILMVVTHCGFYISRVVILKYEHDISYVYKIEKVGKFNEFDWQCANYEYLPINAVIANNYIQNRENNVVILYGNIQIENEKKERNNMQFSISNTYEESILELPYIYYLGYDIKLNEKEIDYQESENGFICITIPKGEEGTIKVKYTGTKLGNFSFYISFSATVIFIIYIITEKKKR